MKVENYRVKIKKGDYEVEVESNDKKFIDLKLQEFFGKKSLGNTKILPDNAGDIITDFNKKLSLKEFSINFKPKGGAENALGIVYFYEEFEGLKNIPKSDILKRFKEIGYKHSNPGVAVKQASDKGLIREVNSKCYCVTMTGEKFIKERLSTPN